jgi:hypothetical protein
MPRAMPPAMTAIGITTCDVTVGGPKLVMCVPEPFPNISKRP